MNKEDLNKKLIEIIKRDFYIVKYKDNEFIHLNTPFFNHFNFLSVRNQYNFINEYVRKVFIKKYGKEQNVLVKYEMNNRSWFLNINYLAEYFLLVLTRAKKGKRFENINKEILNLFWNGNYILHLYLNKGVVDKKDYPIIYSPDFCYKGLSLGELRTLKQEVTKCLKHKYLKHLSNFNKLDIHYIIRLLGNQFNNYIANNTLILHF